VSTSSFEDLRARLREEVGEMPPLSSCLSSSTSTDGLVRIRCRGFELLSDLRGRSKVVPKRRTNWLIKDMGHLCSICTRSRMPDADYVRCRADLSRTSVFSPVRGTQLTPSSQVWPPGGTVFRFRCVFQPGTPYGPLACRASKERTCIGGGAATLARNVLAWWYCISRSARLADVSGRLTACEYHARGYQVVYRKVLSSPTSQASCTTLAVLAE
jgi:hypothetical protein